jgi:hypothetical protein
MKGLFAFAAAAGVANAFVARGYSNTTEEMTTSTIYATQIRTVTHCPETVTNCPLKPSVVTETIAISTTVCPVTQVHPPVTTRVAPPPPPPTGNWTSTLYTTKTYVISKCGPEVPHCPIGETTTTIYATATTCYTDVPVKPTQPGKPVTPPVQTPGKPVSPPAETPGKPVSPPAESHPAGCKGDECKPVTPPAQTQPGKPVTTPAATTPVVVVPRPSGTAPAQVTAGAARNGFEIAAAAAGLAALFL